jgi:hypothetical protein
MKKFAFKKVYLFFSSLFIFVLHVPFVFAKTKPPVNFPDNKPVINPIIFNESFLINNSMAPITGVTLFDSLRLGSLGLARQAFDYAVKGFNVMKSAGEVANDNIISIIDFSKPSSQKRLFVIDLANCRVLFNTYVAHGMQSGKQFANRFSNKPESNKSSLGFYETLTTYNGGNGYSLKLQGVERGINDNAGKRAIVIHGADYVDESFIRSQGYIGRSWGCPALPQRLHKAIIDVIKNGTCLFIYSPDKNYISHSNILKSQISPSLAFK